MTQGDWPIEVSRVIAQQVVRARKQRKMSAQQLSDRCGELGHPIARSVIANLESGRRESVTVAEVAILGAALDVPPALLLYDLRRQAEIQMLPGNEATPWTAYRWFIGELPWTAPGEGELGRAVEVEHFEQWRQAREPLSMLREHSERVGAADLELTRDTGDDDGEQAERTLAALRRLHLLRLSMETAGVELPELRSDLDRALGAVKDRSGS